jgi:Flp pilus assembly protein TadG
MRWMKWHRLNKAKEKGRSLWGDRSGVTAIEFSMIALPFFVLAFGIIEVGVSHFVNRMVDNAVISASRLIRTGQADQSGISADDFKTQICGFMPEFMCNEDRIFVEVSAVNNFSDANSTDSLYDSDGNLKETFGFDVGGAGGIVVVNVIYKWPMMTSALQLDHSDNGGERHLTSTMVFRNEPYE